jgi:hypothetical protein
MTSTEELIAPFKAAVNTLKASRFKVWLAIVFGKKVIVVDEGANDYGCEVTMHKFRGTYYLTDYRRLDSHT